MVGLEHDTTTDLLKVGGRLPDKFLEYTKHIHGNHIVQELIKSLDFKNMVYMTRLLKNPINKTTLLDLSLD